MEQPPEELIAWTPDMLLEISLPASEDFLRVKETLTRIGISSKKENILFQSCHILQKKGKFYLVHFKEMFLLDGRKSDISKTQLDTTKVRNLTTTAPKDPRPALIQYFQQAI